jgi:hypothetical protein
MLPTIQNIIVHCSFVRRVLMKKHFVPFLKKDIPIYTFLTPIGSSLSVLRIRDVYPGSRILIFTHPGSRIQKQQQKRGVKKKLLSNLFL